MNTQQIREAQTALVNGKAIVSGPTDLDKAIVSVLVRRKRGDGPDARDPLGAEATAMIDQSLAA